MISSRPMTSTRTPTVMLEELASTRDVPPLEAGDHLTRVEFERRDAAMRGDRKFELLGGVVYVSSPTKFRHAKPHSLASWIAESYASETPSIEVGADASIRLSEDDEVRPDVILWIDAGASSRARIDADGYVTGSPELAIEVASSSASYDAHAKADLYRRQGFAEYLLYIVQTCEVRWFALENGAYVRLPVDDRGIIRSRILPGLWLDERAFAAHDRAKIHAVLREGLQSPEHAAFVAGLRPPTGA